MNILYYSVHQILEHDEVQIFRSLGHDVMCLGENYRCGSPGVFRPQTALTPREEHLYCIYEGMGGTYRSRGALETLPDGLMEHFSAAVIMHDADFIRRSWHTLRTRPTIWRTIGQGVDEFETGLSDLRADGLKIVRYTPRELELNPTLGQEAVIRFGKDPHIYGDWSGDNLVALTFANWYENRYPQDAYDFREIAKELPFVLGGSSNRTMAQAVGLVEAEQQPRLYRSARVYLYASGLSIPYTLNFIEAWMTGIPVVVYAPYARIGRYFEVDKLVQDGESGFVCRDIETTRACIRSLLDSRSLAHHIGAAGRVEAIRLFGLEVITKQWQSLFSRLI